MRVTSPSLCRLGIFLLAFCGRWQPKQLGFHDEWQAMQLMLAVRGGQALASPPPDDRPTRSGRPAPKRTVLASPTARCSARLLRVDGVDVCTTSQLRPSSTIEFWKMLSPTRSKRRLPKACAALGGCGPAVGPDVYAAGPVVCSVGRARATCRGSRCTGFRWPARTSP